MTPKLLRRSLMASLATAALLGTATPAHAGALVASAKDCPATSLSRPFARWLDPLNYTLVPGGSFEAGAPDWKRSKASVVLGNESFFVRSPFDARSLSIAPGGSAQSPVICAGVDHLVMRFFARRNGGGLLSSLTAPLKVEVLYEDAGGTVRALPLVSVSGGTSWSPGLQVPVVGNLLPLLPGELTPLAFRFTATGSTGWMIDDVYLDPQRRS